MAEKYDPMLDLGHLVVTGLTYRNDTYHWASRIAERLGISEDDYAETVAGVLREALGVPAADRPVLARALCDWAAVQDRIAQVAARAGNLAEAASYRGDGDTARKWAEVFGGSGKDEGGAARVYLLKCGCQMSDGMTHTPGDGVLCAGDGPGARHGITTVVMAIPLPAATS